MTFAVRTMEVNVLVAVFGTMTVISCLILFAANWAFHLFDDTEKIVVSVILTFFFTRVHMYPWKTLIIDTASHVRNAIAQNVIEQQANE